MKVSIILIQALLISALVSANNLIKVNEQTVVHLLCPAAVSYVQVGNAEKLIAETIDDYPNIVRLKALEIFTDTSSLTLVCQDKLYAFEVSYHKTSALKINLNDFKGEAFLGLSQSAMPLHKIQSAINRMQTMELKRSISKVKENDIELVLEGICVKHDLLFMKLNVKNNSNLIYRGECPVFLMRDKRPKKAANVQEYMLEPIQVSQKILFIKPQYTSIVILVFKSFSIPKHKEVEVLLKEQTSGYTGRDLTLNFNNKAIVKAAYLQ
ncbi:DUF4138 domain-containing protein [Carboxylicivirga sp. N1Y90]|uniref:DUF4138 domain-containing protein n=1 Tax=Carboxylicivirga fragile TaxID=3417571 RepID=UPI003D343CD2|nr:DUF4138 domain-containing protein [Marinilabiliaceae bacterium N1Y90]